MNNTSRSGPVDASFPASLRSRVPAQSVMTEFLRAQTRRETRTRFARVFGTSALSEESQPWYRDALGELAVGTALEQLGDGWVVLHAVPLGAPDDDIDHIAIGPAGIFSLSTTNYSGQSVVVAKRVFEVAGTKYHHIRSSEFDVGRVERALGAASGSPVRATGVIVVVNAKSITVREMPRDVAVVNSDDLVRWLHARPAVLSPADVERLASLAEKPPTWLPSAVLQQDGERLHAEFGAAHREVAVAHKVRRLWFATLTAALLLLVGLGAWGVILATAPVAG